MLISAPTDEQHVDEDDENLSSQAQQTPTIAADVETLYNSESKIHLTIHVSGGRNLKEFEDKMELEILADCIGNVVSFLYRNVVLFFCNNGIAKKADTFKWNCKETKIQSVNRRSRKKV